MARSRLLPVAVAAAAAIALQLAVAAAGATYLLTQLTMAVYSSLVVLGLCLLMGYAGQISLGHAGFCAIGGYTSAVLTTVDLSPMGGSGAMQLLERLHVVAQRTDAYGGKALSVAPWAAALVALLLAGIVAVAIGLPTLRLRGHYLAMATLGFGLIVHRVLLGVPLLGGADGISGVPPFRLFAIEVSGRIRTRVENYYVACAVVLVAMLLSLNLVSSRVGRALRAIHDSEEAAASLGVDTSRYKLATFVMSALLAAVAGIFLAHYTAGIGPSEATTMRSIRWVSIVAVGGMGSIWGAVVTAVILGFLSLRGIFGSLDDAVFGAILVAVMVFSPQGLPGLAIAVRSVARRARGKRAGGHG
jgi:branched-chain amino acid transport system permease protein